MNDSAVDQICAIRYNLSVLWEKTLGYKTLVETIEKTSTHGLESSKLKEWQRLANLHVLIEETMDTMESFVKNNHKTWEFKYDC